ncbi:hypothetical protein E2V57_12910 [Salmonella enterica]|nr:hypothetical protein [Salmonella enterica subsp. enterica]EAO2581014.1 hypothetical protein [Salmonella enterica]EBI1600209.1 hypothetical protein [Salmonella enterica]EBP9896480.1 hypothetical protein [Salmonella enterica]ECQ7947488.1 hypothetical protein [Salmonella enterica]
MHRIDTPTAQKDKFGQGKNGFTNGDPATGRRATDLNSDMWDAVQEEVCTVIEAAGIPLSKGEHTQLHAAIGRLIDEQVKTRLEKKQNGADIPNKPLFLQNVGLGEAAKRNVGTGENQIPDMTSFASGDGWMKLPNGKILQYGRGAITPTLSTQTMRITFSIPFPKKVDCAMLTHSGDGGAPLGAGRGFVMTAEGPTLTGFNSAYRTASTSSTVSMNYSWWAVGE